MKTILRIIITVFLSCFSCLLRADGIIRLELNENSSIALPAIEALARDKDVDSLLGAFERGATAQLRQAALDAASDLLEIKHASRLLQLLRQNTLELDEGDSEVFAVMERNRKALVFVLQKILDSPPPGDYTIKEVSDFIERAEALASSATANRTSSSSKHVVTSPTAPAVGIITPRPSPKTEIAETKEPFSFWSAGIVLVLGLFLIMGMGLWWFYRRVDR